MYTSEEYLGDYKVSLMMRESLEDLFFQYGVDAVFAGHYHAYERSCPVYKEQCRYGDGDGDGDGEPYSEAPVYVVVGSAGAYADNVPYCKTLIAILWGEDPISFAITIAIAISISIPVAAYIR